MKTTAGERQTARLGAVPWELIDRILDDFAALEAENAKLRKSLRRACSDEGIGHWYDEAIALLDGGK